MQEHKFAIIVNPRSGNGRTGKRWPQIAHRIRNEIGEFDLFKTESPSHGTELTRNALRDGYDRIVAVGGDGTYYEVVNGFFDGTELVNPDATLVVLPAGSGSDLAKTLQIPRGKDAYSVLNNESTIGCDLGRVTYQNESGEEAVAHIINVAHAGFGGAVAERINRGSKFLGGFASYLWNLLVTLKTYENPELQICIDDREITGKFKDIIIANGRYEGGGMFTAPNAELDSGVFETFLIGDISRFEALKNIRLLYKGKLDTHPQIEYVRPKTISIESEQRVPINLDGEFSGHLPAKFEIVPQAIRIVTALPCTTKPK